MSFVVTNTSIGNTEAQAQRFGEPRLGDDSLLQMLLDEVDMLFLSHRMIVYLGFDYKDMNL